MKIAHFDCFSGISGDMVLGALIDAGVPGEVITNAIAGLGLPVQIEIERVKKCGIAATKVNIIAEDQEDYRFLPDVQAIIEKGREAGKLTVKQLELAMKIFRIVAEAEAKVHGISIDKVHFHEVGALDSIADIVGAAVGIDWLNVDQWSCSAVVVGSGMVKCAHGLMPVPAPATALILEGIPIATSNVKGELCTPTGAAILKAIVTEFSTLPGMTIRHVGHGAGTKDLLDQPNVVRLFVGEANKHVDGNQNQQVTLLETNLDDCTGEIVGYTIERLFLAGALDVYTIPIQMKKQRPGVMLCVLASGEKVLELEAIIFRETGTFGIRRAIMQRTILQRKPIILQTALGPIKAKHGELTTADSMAAGHEIVTPEYEECARIARENNIPLREVYALAKQVIRK